MHVTQAHILCFLFVSFLLTIFCEFSAGFFMQHFFVDCIPCSYFIIFFAIFFLMLIHLFPFFFYLLCCKEDKLKTIQLCLLYLQENFSLLWKVWKNGKEKFVIKKIVYVAGFLCEKKMPQAEELLCCLYVWSSNSC